MLRTRLTWLLTGLVALTLASGGTILLARRVKPVFERQVRYLPSESEADTSDSQVSPSSTSIAAESVTALPKFKVAAGSTSWEYILGWFADISGLAYAEGDIKLEGSVTLLPAPGNQKEYTVPEIVDLLNGALSASNKDGHIAIFRREYTFSIIDLDQMLLREIAKPTSLDELDDFGRTEFVTLKIPLKKGDATRLATKLKSRDCPVYVTVLPNSLWLSGRVGDIRTCILPMLDDRE